MNFLIQDFTTGPEIRLPVTLGQPGPKGEKGTVGPPGPPSQVSVEAVKGNLYKLCVNNY